LRNVVILYYKWEIAVILYYKWEIGNQFDHLIINFPFVMQND
jgi:hypothetical protein